MSKETFLVEIVEQKTRTIQVEAYSLGCAYERVCDSIKYSPLIDPSITFTIKSITAKPQE